VDLAEFPFAIDIGDDDVGWLGSESLTPALFPERWLYVRMENLSDAELELRGWDDWSIWEEIRGDADEWEARTPVPAEEVSLQEEGLVVYPSFEAWQAAQEAPQD
jgi:hypothetical protein